MLGPLLRSLGWAPLKGSADWLMAVNVAQGWATHPQLYDHRESSLYVIDPARGAAAPSVGPISERQRAYQARDAFGIADFLVRQQATGRGARAMSMVSLRAGAACRPMRATIPPWVSRA